ncbi:MAG: hypothetical protein SO314_05350 [Alphaproteobacteria bacterium]|nr:hypothetical protein [Alphaproteobacteria bacterium]
MTTEAINDLSDIMETYRHYVYSLRAIEAIISQHSNCDFYRKRVQFEGKKMDTIEDCISPIWHETKCSPEIREIFEDIGKIGEMNVKNSCCIFINSTGPKVKNAYLQGKQNGMYTCEISFDYPTMVHSAAFIYGNDAQLKDMSFLVDGKYFLSYNGVLKEEKFSETLTSSLLFYQQLETAICAIAKKISLDEQKIPYRNSDIWFDSYASSYVKGLEATVLENQGKFIECARKFLRQKLKTSADNTFTEAEKQGLILSAVRFNEYKDIRNLINHYSDYHGQNDLAVKKDKNNEDIFERLKTIYAKYYVKSLRERVGVTLEMLCDFQKLIEQINPNFLIRRKGESSNKFIKRIKEKLQSVPAQDIHIDINSPLHEQTYKKIKKNINKLFPDVVLETECPEYYGNLDEMCEMSSRKMMISSSWGDLSKVIDYYFISHGIKVEQKKKLKMLQKMRVLPPQQIVNLYKIRQFRNELCHNLLTPETINKLRTGCINIINEITEIRAEMIKKIPKGTIKNDIIEYKHDNGKIVKVHKDTLEIISVTEPKLSQPFFFINRCHNHK